MKRVSLLVLIFLVLGAGVFVFLKARTSCRLPTSSNAAYAALPDSEILISVGEEKLTKADIEANVSMALKLATYRAGKDLSESTRANIADRARMGLFKQFPDRSLVHLALAGTNGVSVTEEALTAKRTAFLKKFVRSGGSTEAAWKTLNGSERRALEGAIRSQVELDLHFSNNCSNQIVVTEEEIERALQRTRDWNAKIDATNAYAYATASNILKQVEAGADFGELADKYSQDPDKQPGGLINEPAAVYFSNGRTSYLDMLEQMPAGRVTDILECTEGLLIVKVLPVSKRTKMHDYQRIVLQTGVKYPEFTREDMIRIGKDEVRQKIYQDLLAEVRKTIKVDYPKGADFLSKKNTKPSPAKKGKVGRKK